MRPTAVLLMILMWAGLPAAAVTGDEEPLEQLRLSPQMPYTAERSDPIRHDVDFTVVVTPPYHCKVLRVWIPVPQSDVAQQVGESQFTTFPEDVEPQIGTEPVFGNRFAYFEFHHPQGAQLIRHRFQATVWNLRWDVDPERAVRVDSWPAAFGPWLRPQAVDDERSFRAVLSEIIPAPGLPVRDLTAVFDWVDHNLTYDHVNASLSADANHAFAERRGHCSDYHGLCAAMGRMLGSPTQVTYGLSLFPKNSPSHCKLEAFLPPFGWVSFDVSETQKLIQQIQNDTSRDETERQQLVAAARERLYSGFRENSWLLLTRGTDYDLAPPASQPVRVVRTAWVEADGEPLPDPDPASAEQREFAWMTAHRYSADRPFPRPFSDPATLKMP